MGGKCTDCNIEYHQFKATWKPNEGTKRYYRCPKCETIYIEHDIDGETIVKSHKPKPKPVVTLDNWNETLNCGDDV